MDNVISLKARKTKKELDARIKKYGLISYPEMIRAVDAYARHCSELDAFTEDVIIDAYALADVMKRRVLIADERMLYVIENIRGVLATQPLTKEMGLS